MVNTLIACGTGGIVVLFIIKMIPGGKWSIIQLINGCLAGIDLDNDCFPPLFCVQEWSLSVLVVTGITRGELPW